MTDTNATATATAINPRSLRKQQTGTGAIAKREWVDAQGKEVEEKEATGIKYTLLANPGNPFVYQMGGGLKAGDPEMMLACFGALTLAGNVVNSTKDGEDPIQNVTDRFTLIDSGEWVVREGFGPKYDLDLLAQAIAQVKGDSNVALYRGKMGTKVLIGTKQVPYETAAMRRDDVKAVYATLKPPTPVAAPDLGAL